MGMWSPVGGVAKALGKGLLREPGIVAVNFLPRTNLTPRLGSYQRAMQSVSRPRTLEPPYPGAGFSVQADEGNLLAVQPCGGLLLSEAGGVEWRRRIRVAGREVA